MERAHPPTSCCVPMIISGPLGTWRLHPPFRPPASCVCMRPQLPHLTFARTAPCVSDDLVCTPLFPAPHRAAGTGAPGHRGDPAVPAPVSGRQLQQGGELRSGSLAGRCVRPLSPLPAAAHSPHTRTHSRTAAAFSAEAGQMRGGMLQRREGSMGHTYTHNGIRTRTRAAGVVSDTRVHTLCCAALCGGAACVAHPTPHRGARLGRRWHHAVCGRRCRCHPGSEPRPLCVRLLRVAAVGHAAAAAVAAAAAGR